MSLSLPDAARDLLNKPAAHALVITTNKDSSPHATLVWVEERDGALTFNTATGRRKWFNMRRTPRIVVSVQDPDAPRTYAVFEGTALLSEEGANDQINRLSKKVHGPRVVRRLQRQGTPRHCPPGPRHDQRHGRLDRQVAPRHPGRSAVGAPSRANQRPRRSLRATRRGRSARAEESPDAA